MKYQYLQHYKGFGMILYPANAYFLWKNKFIILC